MKRDEEGVSSLTHDINKAEEEQLCVAVVYPVDTQHRIQKARVNIFIKAH